MTSELVAGFTLIGLLGLMSGRSTATRLLALSNCSLMIWVTSWLPGVLAAALSLAATPPPSSLASASGTTLSSPSDCTTVNPMVRSTAKKWL